MPIRKYKPTTPGRRGMTSLTFDEITTQTPHAPLTEKLQEGTLIVIDELTAKDVKTKAAVGVLKSIGVTGKVVLVDAMLDEKFAMSVRNIAGVSLVQSNRVTARDVANSRQVVLTKAAVEKLEAALGA